jgi:AcrR family transcriptional regulator
MDQRDGPTVGTAAGHDAPEPERSARREATRQRILDAAREVFAERGVIGGTVEDICDRAGFTRGAFYSNFADKDDVLEALVEREQGRLLDHLDASFAVMEEELGDAPDLASAIGPIVDRILRSIPIDRQLLLVRTELEIHAIRIPELSASFRETEAAFRERISGFIEEAMARYGLEPLVPASVLADAALGIMERSVRRALLAGPGTDPDEIARATLPHLFLSATRPTATIQDR